MYQLDPAFPELDIILPPTPTFSGIFIIRQSLVGQKRLSISAIAELVRKDNGVPLN